MQEICAEIAEKIAEVAEIVERKLWDCWDCWDCWENCLNCWDCWDCWENCLNCWSSYNSKMQRLKWIQGNVEFSKTNAWGLIKKNRLSYRNPSAIGALAACRWRASRRCAAQHRDAACGGFRCRPQSWRPKRASPPRPWRARRPAIGPTVPRRPPSGSSGISTATAGWPTHFRSFRPNPTQINHSKSIQIFKKKWIELVMNDDQ